MIVPEPTRLDRVLAPLWALVCALAALALVCAIGAACLTLAHALTYPEGPKGCETVTVEDGVAWCDG